VALLLAERPRPQTQPQMGWGFVCHCSWIRLWPRSFGFWQFCQPLRKSEPLRIFASSICTRPEVATQCCRAQHIYSWLPSAVPGTNSAKKRDQWWKDAMHKLRAVEVSVVKPDFWWLAHVPEVSDELVSIWKHRKAEPLRKEALYMSKWCRWQVFENVSGSLKGDGADAGSDIAWSKEV